MSKPNLKRNQILGLIYRQLILYRRYLERKFEIAFWPCLDVLIYGAIGNYAAKAGGGNQLALVLVGVLMGAIVWQSHIHLVKFFMQEMWDKNMLYLLAQELSGTSVVLAAVTIAVLATIVSTAITIVAALVLFELKAIHLSPSFLSLIPVLMALGWSTATLGLALVVRFGGKADNFVWAVGGIIAPLSGAMVPIDNFPPAMRAFARLLPTTHAYNAGRAILLEGTFPMGEYLVALVGTVAAFMLALFALHRAALAFRERGYITRYV